MTRPSHCKAALGRGHGMALLGVSLLTVLASCDRRTVTDPPAGPSLDVQLRQQLGLWGAIPIGAVAPADSALVIPGL